MVEFWRWGGLKFTARVLVYLNSSGGIGERGIKEEYPYFGGDVEVLTDKGEFMEFFPKSIVKGKGGKVKDIVDLYIRHVFLYFPVVIPNLLHASLIKFHQVEGYLPMTPIQYSSLRPPGFKLLLETLLFPIY